SPGRRAASAASATILSSCRRATTSLSANWTRTRNTASATALTRSPSWWRTSSLARVRPMARALYIHWPFCLKKCPYCDFNSHVRDGVDPAEWQQALITDMRHEAACAGGEPLDSVFFGGGTPSL